jgi:hypothetical protein
MAEPPEHHAEAVTSPFARESDEPVRSQPAEDPDEAVLFDPRRNQPPPHTSHTARDSDEAVDFEDRRNYALFSKSRPLAEPERAVTSQSDNPSSIEGQAALTYRATQQPPRYTGNESKRRPKLDEGQSDDSRPVAGQISPRNPQDRHQQSQGRDFSDLKPSFVPIDRIHQDVVSQWAIDYLGPSATVTRGSSPMEGTPGYIVKTRQRPTQQMIALLIEQSKERFLKERHERRPGTEPEPAVVPERLPEPPSEPEPEPKPRPKPRPAPVPKPKPGMSR